MESKQPRVFISHSSSDKEFVIELATKLRSNRVNVWYDDWEIAIGDSIVEKVFAGLDASDTILIILSPESVKSKWVKEELNVAVMRRLSISNIRLLPVLIETCDIPTPLQHIRYADFRTDDKEATRQILEVLSPSDALWQSLSNTFEEFCSITDLISISHPSEPVGDKLLRLYSLLEKALNLRTNIEFRESQAETKELDFYEKITFLCGQGIEARSVVWHALVYYRSCIAHASRDTSKDLAIFAEMLDGTGYFAQSVTLGLKRPLVFPDAYDAVEDISEAIKMAMQELRAVMHLLCFENWNRRDPYARRE